ncbi:MAG: hypothetical protein U0163_10085 [Gemmatimonadaceae bacterium]
MRRLFIAATTCGLAAVARAQDPGAALTPFDQKKDGSSNMHALAHVEGHQGPWKAADLEIEQDKDRPYVYLCGFVNFDVQIYDISNTSSPKKIFDWTIENPELHRGIGAMDGKYFKIKGRYYYAQSFQFMQGSPDTDLGAVIFDVTGLPDPSKVKVVARIRYPQAPGGFHNTFAYKHSDGRALLRHGESAQGAHLRPRKGGEWRRPEHLADWRGAQPDTIPADRLRRVPRLLRRLRPGHQPRQVLRRWLGRILSVGCHQA